VFGAGFLREQAAEIVSRGAQLENILDCSATIQVCNFSAVFQAILSSIG
jgi:hypothetical protein